MFMGTNRKVNFQILHNNRHQQKLVQTSQCNWQGRFRKGVESREEEVQNYVRDERDVESSHCDKEVS